ncbi:hypothetical protein KEM54_000265 [Ascosphaera aggregata]|nr:hypothetical protein KEM54_000265 [Ascosphaera aggregata]
MATVSPPSSHDHFVRPRSAISVAHPLKPPAFTFESRDQQSNDYPRRPPCYPASSAKNHSRRLTRSMISPSGIQLKKDDRPQSASLHNKDSMENVKRSFFRRKSRAFRRQTSELNLADSFKEPLKERERSPSLSRRHRPRPIDMRNAFRKKSISEPYGFQHIIHTSQEHFTCLAQANINDLATEMSIVKASQRPESDLKGIRAASLHTSRSPRRQGDERAHNSLPRIPVQCSTSPVITSSLLQPGMLAVTHDRPVSIATPPDIPEPSSDIIDALLGMHSTTEPVRSDFYGQQVGARDDRTRNLPEVDLMRTLNATPFKETSPCGEPAVGTTSAYERFKGLPGYLKEDPARAASGPTPSATAPRVPAGPLSKMHKVHQNMHIEFNDTKEASAPGSPKLCASSDTDCFPTFESIEKMFEDYPRLVTPDPGIGVAISTDDTCWKWEDDIDLVYESPKRETSDFSWWHSPLNAAQRIAMRRTYSNNTNNRETFLSSSVSSMADEDTTALSTAPTSVFEYANTTQICKDSQRESSRSSLNTSGSFDTFNKQAPLAPERLTLNATNRSKSQEAIGTFQQSPKGRGHRSSISVSAYVPELVHSRTLAANGSEFQKNPDTRRKTPSGRSYSMKDSSAFQRERILLSQPLPPPPIALPPIPINARQSPHKPLTIHCDSDKKFSSLAETHPGEETPPLAPTALGGGKSHCAAQLKNCNSSRGSSMKCRSANRAISCPPRRRLSYSLFPFPDKNPPSAVATVPSPIPSNKPTFF